MFEVSQLSCGYTDAPVVTDLSFAVKRASITCLVGSNGAGKTTTFRGLVGDAKLFGGSIVVDDARIERPDPVAMFNHGVVMVPEGRQVFVGMSVRENLLVGGYNVRSGAELRRRTDEIFERFPPLRERANISAGMLSGGEQQMLAIGRALMAKPSYLLLDEPSMGLAPRLVQLVSDLIVALAKSGLGILLAEQNAHMALAIADYALIIDRGTSVMSGKAQWIAQQDIVTEAYFGI